MKHKKLLNLGLIFLALSAAALFVSIRTRRAVQVQQEPPIAGNFAFPDLNGKVVHLTDFRGKVVLLDFWATWCGPCVEEVPELKGFYEKFKNKGFTIIGISMDEEGKDVVAPFVKSQNIPYPILLAKGDSGPDYPIHALPYAFLIDRNGRIVQEYVGFKFGDDVDRDITAALNEKF